MTTFPIAQGTKLQGLLDKGDRAFVDGVSRVALRADNPDALATALRTDGFRDETAVFDARLHLLDPARNIHLLAYTSGVIKFFAPSWDVLRPVITSLAERGQVR